MKPAELLLQSLGVTSPSEIDVEAIAWHTKAEIKYRELDGCEARIIGIDNRAIITVKNSHITRQRFSIAHELGHWYHHRGKSFFCRPEDIGNQTKPINDFERVADRYAADLLMPNYLFKDIAGSFDNPSFKTVEELSRIFTTSFLATAIRYAEFGPHPCILVCYNQKRLKWFTKNKELPIELYLHKELDPNSKAFDVVFGRKTEASKSKIRANAWLNMREAGNYEISEETKKLSSNDVVTILTFHNERLFEGLAA